MKIRAGLNLPSGLAMPDEISSYGAAADSLGFDSLWVVDRLLGRHPELNGSWPDAVATLAFLISVTRKIKLGTRVFVVPYRHPLFVAKMTATLDYLSNGRFLFGVGVGWQPKEFESLGINLTERGKRTDESLEIVKKLWRGESTSFHGSYFDLDNAQIDPLPSTPSGPQIWYGGGSIPQKALQKNPTLGPRDPRPVLKRIAKWCDGWMPRSSAPNDMVQQDLDIIKEYAKEFGRNADEIEVASADYIHVYEEGDEQKAEELVKRATSLDFKTAKQEYMIGTVDEVRHRLESKYGGEKSMWSYTVINTFDPSIGQIELIKEKLLC